MGMAWAVGGANGNTVLNPKIIFKNFDKKSVCFIDLDRAKQYSMDLALVVDRS
jgi:hypothetical protein